MISLLYTKPVDAFKHLRNRWVKFAMNTKQYNLGIFREKKRFRIILESLRSPLNQEQTVVLLLQAVTQDVVLPHAAVLCKFEGCRAFPNSTGYYSDMDGFEWELDCTSKFFSSPLPVGSDYFSLPHVFSMLPVPSGKMKLCYNNKTPTSLRLIFYSHKIC